MNLPRVAAVAGFVVCISLSPMASMAHTEDVYALLGKWRTTHPSTNRTYIYDIVEDSGGMGPPRFIVIAANAGEGVAAGQEVGMFEFIEGASPAFQGTSDWGDWDCRPLAGSQLQVIFLNQGGRQEIWTRGR